MSVINRVILLLTGAVLLAGGGAGLSRGLGIWGDAGSPVLPADLIPEISANPWATEVVAAVAAVAAITAVGVLLANITPVSRLLAVARSNDGQTQVRTSSLLLALREDVRHSLEVTQVRTSLRGRVAKPRIRAWVVAGSIDSPRELLSALAAGPAARVRVAAAEPQLPISVYLRFPTGIASNGRTPVA